VVQQLIAAKLLLTAFLLMEWNAQICPLNRTFFVL